MSRLTAGILVDAIVHSSYAWDNCVVAAVWWRMKPKNFDLDLSQKLDSMLEIYVICGKKTPETMEVEEQSYPWE